MCFVFFFELLITAGTVVCDRNSIMQSLLNNPKNPYTGLEMKIEDCEECPELKKKIGDLYGEMGAKEQSRERCRNEIDAKHADVMNECEIRMKKVILKKDCQIRKVKKHLEHTVVEYERELKQTRQILDQRNRELSDLTEALEVKW